MRLYRVKVIKGGRSLTYREPGGKTYTQYNHAINQLVHLRRSGVNAILLQTPEFEWEQLDVDLPTDLTNYPWR